MQASRVNTVYDNGDLAVLVIERVNAFGKSADAGYVGFGSLTPVAVVSCTERETRGFDMNAEPLDLLALERLAPDLKAALRRVAGQRRGRQ